MNHTIEDSEPCIVCMSTRRNEKEFEVISNGEKEINFLDLEINLEDGVLREDNTIQTKNGIVRFAKEAYRTVANNRINRKAPVALSRKNIEIEK